MPTKRTITPHTRGEHTWQEIANRIGEAEGRTLSHAAVQGTAERALKKLKRGLENDPVIKDWLIENGLLEPEQ